MDLKEIRNNIDLTINKIPSYLFIIPYILHTISTDTLFRQRSKFASTPGCVYDVIISNIGDYTEYRCLTDFIAVIILAYLLSKYIFLNRYKWGEDKSNTKSVGDSIFKYISIILFRR